MFGRHFRSPNAPLLINKQKTLQKTSTETDQNNTIEEEICYVFKKMYILRICPSSKSMARR